MARTKGGFKTRQRRKRVLNRAKGYYGARRKLYAVAKETVDRALAYAFSGRKEKKRQYRRLWITRINAAVRPLEMSYSRFMNGLIKAGIPARPSRASQTLRFTTRRVSKPLPRRPRRPCRSAERFSGRKPHVFRFASLARHLRRSGFLFPRMARWKSSSA